MKLWRKKGRKDPFAAMLLTFALSLYGCETSLTPYFPDPRIQTSEGGIVVGDEPQSVLIAMEVLDKGGSAADAAVALGFALSVTYQNAAGLGAGGICLVHQAASGLTEALDFSPAPAIARASSARWQVSVPALSRGLFALHSKYGTLPWQTLVVPAENLARFGFTITKAFASALSSSSSALVNDPEALSSFSSSRRVLLIEGERFRQLDLAAVLGRIRGRTPGDFYAGALATELSDSSRSTGASLAADDLRQFTPRWLEAMKIDVSGMRLEVALVNADIEQFSNNLRQVQHSDAVVGQQTPSYTGFIVADANENLVACTLTMIEPFGTGIVMDNFGFLLAPSPEILTEGVPPMVSVLARQGRQSSPIFAAAYGGSHAFSSMANFIRQQVLKESPLESTIDMEDATDGGTAGPYLAKPNAITCPKRLSSGLSECIVHTDPNRFGYGSLTYGDS